MCCITNVAAAPTIALGELCTDGDLCSDINAECRGGVCRCRDGSAADTGHCGKYRWMYSIDYVVMSTLLIYLEIKKFKLVIFN